jgi:PAS domain S-box-containing protein
VSDRSGSSPAADWRPHAVAYLLVALLLLSLLALAFSALRFERNLIEVREAEGDNRAWNVSQLEVDYQDFLIAIQDARGIFRSGDPALVAQADAAVRLEFDIFYSRIAAFNATIEREDLDAPYRDRLDHLFEFRDMIALGIDDMPVGDAARLEEIYPIVSALEADVRYLAVRTLQALVGRAESARLEEKRLLRSFLQQSIFLLLLTLVAASLALRLVGLIRKQARETLRAQTLINKAFEGAQEGVLVCDSQGRIVLSNPTARAIFGHGPDELEGHLLSETVVPPSRMRRFRMGMDALLSEAGAVGSAGLGPLQFEGLRADGTLLKASVALRAEGTSDGDMRIFVFVRDITEAIEVGQRLRAALRAAREHSSAKGRFLATMSHEMRTPLHGVVASLDLLRTDSLDAEAASLLTTARSCSERALAQIDYALDAIRNEGDGEPPSRFDPVASVRSIVAEMEPLARIKGNSIDFDVTGFDGSTTLVGQPKAYSRSVFNLVGNAVKFTSDGRISIRLHIRAGAGDGQRELLTEVRDTGPGIAKKDWERIFAPFEQSDASERTTANPGFGLGLSIVQQDVERMRGRIEIDSEPGNGACLRFTIPLIAAETAPPERTDQPDDMQDAVAREVALHAGSISALVVDDNTVNCALVARMLEQLGFTAQCCHSGAEAVEMARTRFYGVILMDLRMIGMDGVEATGLIRRGGASRDALVVAITAQVDFATSEAFRTSDMTSVLTKPFGKTELAAHLAEQGVVAGGVQTPHGSDDAEAQEARASNLLALQDAVGLIGPQHGLALAIDVCAGARAAISAARIGDPATAEKAHSAAGSALMIGFRQLGRLLQRLENTASDAGGKPADDQVPLLTELATEVGYAEAALEVFQREGGHQSPAQQGRHASTTSS